MSDQNVTQEPGNLKELLYVKSLPILTKMLGPEIDGTPAKNFRIKDVKIVNAATVVVVEQTYDVKVGIATATPEQIFTREIPYHRYEIGEVFEHYLGRQVFGGKPPTDLAAFKTWVTARTDKIVIDETLYVEFGEKYVSVRPKDLKDLKWHGVHFLNFSESIN